MEFEDSSHLQAWLKNNRNRVNKCISTSECRKWDKWIKHNELPLPCVCSNRNQACIFIESYYKLECALEIMQNIEPYEEALKSHQVVKDNPEAVMLWVKTNEQIGLGIIHFEPIIKIRIESEPYKTMNIKLSASNISLLLSFKELFTECYYSEQYENY